MADQQQTPSTDEWDEVPDYSTQRKEQKVKVDGVRYLLRDMMGEDLGEWMKYQTTRIMGRSKKGRPDPESADFREYNAKLISLCLSSVGADGGLTPVPVAVIRNWTAPVLTALFDLCQTMNGLNEEGQEEAKKA